MISLETHLYLKTAIEAGLLADYVTHYNTTVHRETGKCFWGQYYTLAICSQVKNATHMLSFDRFGQRPPRVPVGGDNLTHPQMQYLVPEYSTFHAQGNFFAADRFPGTKDGNSTIV